MVMRARIPRLGACPGIDAGSTGRRSGRLRAPRRWPRLLLCLAGLLCLGLLLYSTRLPAAEAPLGADLAPPALRAMFGRLDPSVVTINAARSVGEGELLRGFGVSEDDPFMDFIRAKLTVAPGEYLDAVLGSGFVVSPDGYIITAAHVVEDALAVVVELGDHRLLPARVVGSDRETDIALLKIEAGNLVPVVFGKSVLLGLGDRVIAIGAPFGLERSLSTGLVSGRDRLAYPDAWTPMIQTDVAVNPGSSGSPLFNLRGEVVGMNTMIFSYNGGYNGVALAIPSETLSAAVAQFKLTGTLPRRGMGARFRDLPPILAQVLGIDQGRGVIVTATLPRGLAAQAGLLVGDVIMEFDERAIVKAPDLLSALAVADLRQAHRLKVIRDRLPRLLQLPGQLPGANLEPPPR